MKAVCSDCTHRRRVIGSVHVACANPPDAHISIGSGGDERYEKAERMARENQAVVRCVWPGSGMFPGKELFGFDPNTVFACANHQLGEQP